jgi:hypothetical protein
MKKDSFLLNPFLYFFVEGFIFYHFLQKNIIYLLKKVYPWKGIFSLKGRSCHEGGLRVGFWLSCYRKRPGDEIGRRKGLTIPGSVVQFRLPAPLKPHYSGRVSSALPFCFKINVAAGGQAKGIDLRFYT